VQVGHLIHKQIFNQSRSVTKNNHVFFTSSHAQTKDDKALQPLRWLIIALRGLISRLWLCPAGLWCFARNDDDDDEEEDTWPPHPGHPTHHDWASFWKAAMGTYAVCVCADGTDRCTNFWWTRDPEFPSLIPPFDGHLIFNYLRIKSNDGHE
jgi:hypothetical protein